MEFAQEVRSRQRCCISVRHLTLRRIPECPQGLPSTSLVCILCWKHIVLDPYRVGKTRVLLVQPCCATGSCQKNSGSWHRDAHVACGLTRSDVKTTLLRRCNRSCPSSWRVP